PTTDIYTLSLHDALPIYENLTSIPLPKVIRSPANYILLIENLLDISHFYPLHDGNIGDKANSEIPVQLEEGEVDGFPYVKTIREDRKSTRLNSSHVKISY